MPKSSELRRVLSKYIESKNLFFLFNKVSFLPLIHSLSLAFLKYGSLCWEFLLLINLMHLSLVNSLTKPRNVLMTLLEQ